MIKKVLLILVLSCYCLLVIGCQTVSGIGRDIAWTAEAASEVLEGE